MVYSDHYLSIAALESRVGPRVWYFVVYYIIRATVGYLFQYLTSLSICRKTELSKKNYSQSTRWWFDMEEQINY